MLFFEYICDPALLFFGQIVRTYPRKYRSKKSE